MFNFYKYRCNYFSTEKEKSCYNNNNNNIQTIKNPLKLSTCSIGNGSNVCSMLSVCCISFTLGYFTHYYFTRNN